MARQYRYISADSHFESPPEVWTKRIPAEYRDRAPRRIKMPNGYDAILTEGRTIEYGGTGMYGGVGPENFNPAILDFDNTPGCGTAEQRIKEQDTDGIDAEILFTNKAGGGVAKDKKVGLAIIRAYNDYMAEEYCSVAPDRLIPVGGIPTTGVDDAIAEMEHCVKMGTRAVRLNTFPSGKGYPTPEDDRFYAAVLDLDVALTIHTSMTTTQYQGRSVSLMQYPRQPEGEERPPIDFLERIARHGIHHCGGIEAAQLIMTGVFDRFPDLQIYWAENNIGWIPYYYEQMDRAYEVNRHWAQKSLGLEPLSRLPSEYLRDHAHWGFFEDPFGMRIRHEVGVDRIMWSTDFPHIVTRWPHSLETLESQMAGVPEEEKYQIVAGNAIKFFKLQ